MTLDLDEFEYPKADLELVIGRSDGSAIKLEGRDISREHAVLIWQNNSWSFVRKNKLATITKNGLPVHSTNIENGDIFILPPYELHFSGDVNARVNLATLDNNERPIFSDETVEISAPLSASVDNIPE